MIDKRPLDSFIKLALASQYDRTSAVDLVTDGTLMILQQKAVNVTEHNADAHN